MLRARVIPCLLLKGHGLVKTIRFQNPGYVGDPINAVRIFNDKEVDELVLLDIEASRLNRDPAYDQIRDIVDEAFMPVAYGGGLRDIEQVRRLVGLGVEKIIVNNAMLQSPALVHAAAEIFGRQAVSVSINVRRDWRGRPRVYDAAQRRDASVSLQAHVLSATAAGAGELFLNDVNRDGTGSGFDLDLIREVASSVDVPVVACGGAGTLEHLRAAVSAGASGVAAGSMFVYVGKHRAVMITYPEYKTLQSLFSRD